MKRGRSHDSTLEFEDNKTILANLPARGLRPGPSTSLAQDKRAHGTELGRGHIDYRPILKAPIAEGLEELYTEQEPPLIEMPALPAVRVDYDTLCALKLTAG
jgi:hypothetical protein